VLELSGGVGSLPQAPRWNADRRARPSLPSPHAEEKEIKARGRIRRCGRKDYASVGVSPS
jgi:hypothetical protein